MKARSPRAAAAHYVVRLERRHAHLFDITLTIAAPAALQRVSLPVWIPGSYLVREFSKHLQNLSAGQGGRPVAITPIDKAQWQLECAADV